MNKRLESIEGSFRLALASRFCPLFLPSMFLVASQASLNKVSAKFVVLLYGHSQRGKYRPGAKWIIHVPNVYDWRRQEQGIMIDLVVSEVEQYISKGYIEREDFTLATVDADEPITVAKLQRTGDRSVN